jgi:hypothetical protein
MVRKRPLRRGATWGFSVLLVASLSSAVQSDVAGAGAHSSRVATVYPIGTPNSSEPSQYGPPAADALSGYTLSYVADFTGTTVPPGWDIFTGVPGGDPGGHFGLSHVVVANGMLSLNTYRDPSWYNRWVTVRASRARAQPRSSCCGRRRTRGRPRSTSMKPAVRLPRRPTPLTMARRTILWVTGSRSI